MIENKNIDVFKEDKFEKKTNFKILIFKIVEFRYIIGDLNACYFYNLFKNSLIKCFIKVKII